MSLGNLRNLTRASIGLLALDLLDSSSSDEYEEISYIGGALRQYPLERESSPETPPPVIGKRSKPSIDTMIASLKLRSGYNSEIFVTQDAIKDLICSICMGVFRDPIEIGCKENHLLCRKCYLKFIETSENEIDTTAKICPYRCGPMSTDPNRPVMKSIHRAICNQTVRCENADIDTNSKTNNGCLWTGTLSSLDNHLEKTCGWTGMKCNACEQSILRKDMSTHVTVCPQVEIQCELKCGRSIKRLHQSEHFKACPMRIVCCPNRLQGCKSTTKRKEINIHLKECGYQMMHCPFEKFGCKHRCQRQKLTEHISQSRLHHLETKADFFYSEKSNLETRVDELNKETEGLRAKVDELEEKNNKLEEKNNKTEARLEARLELLESRPPSYPPPPPPSIMSAPPPYPYGMPPPPPSFGYPHAYPPPSIVAPPPPCQPSSSSSAPMYPPNYNVYP